jgi:hypothetical protein
MAYKAFAVIQLSLASLPPDSNRSVIGMKREMLQAENDTGGVEKWLRCKEVENGERLSDPP